VYQVAARGFATHGYHATSMRDLAADADLTKGAVMYHAGTKRRLLEEIHARTLTAALDGHRRAAAAGGGAVATLTRMIAAHLGLLAARRDEVVVLIENARQLSDPGARARQAEWRRGFSRVIAQGVRDGELATADPELAALLLAGVLSSTHRWFRPGGGLTPGDVALNFARLAVFGLAPPTPPPDAVAVRRAGRPPARGTRRDGKLGT
jgi:AcrR family transcriptional regulator